MLHPQNRQGRARGQQHSAHGAILAAAAGQTQIRARAGLQGRVQGQELGGQGQVLGGQGKVLGGQARAGQQPGRAQRQGVPRIHAHLQLPLPAALAEDHLQPERPDNLCPSPQHPLPRPALRLHPQTHSAHGVPREGAQEPGLESQLLLPHGTDAQHLPEIAKQQLRSPMHDPHCGLH